MDSFFTDEHRKVSMGTKKDLTRDELLKKCAND